MDNILQALGFISRVIGEEKAAEPSHSTDDEDGEAAHITMSVTDSCGPINNPQPFSIENGADMPPLDQGGGSDGSSTDSESRNSVENPKFYLPQNSSVTSMVTSQIIENGGSSPDES
eukprot:15255278-Ditylum_brightwellii.AAC.1